MTMREVRAMKNNAPPSGPGVEKPATVPRFSLGTPALDSTGLAISYSETVAMTLNGFTLAGQLRSAQWDYGLLKELNQSIIGTKNSGDAYVPGS